MTINSTRVERHNCSEDDEERCYSYNTIFSKDRFSQYALINGLICHKPNSTFDECTTELKAENRQLYPTL